MKKFRGSAAVAGLSVLALTLARSCGGRPTERPHRSDAAWRDR
jgi:hypothetical protein